MAKHTLKVSLLSGAAVVALVVADPHSAQAQMYSTGPGVYLSLEGQYMWNPGSKTKSIEFPSNIMLAPTLGSTIVGAKARANKGWGGKAMLGYRFNNNWDVGVGFAGGWLKGKGHKSGTATTVIRTNDGTTTTSRASVSDKLKVKLTYQVADFEAGYNWTMGNNSNLRLFGGVRFAHFDQRVKGSIDATISTATPGTGFTVVSTAHVRSKRKTTFWGVGPRIGVNGQFGIGASGFNVFGGVSGALLFGKFKDKHSFSINASSGGGPTTTATSVKDKSKSKIVPNAEGEIGLGYNFNTGGGSTVGIQLGYRASGWWGVTSKASPFPINPDGPPFSFKSSKPDDVFVHGPFVRLVATFGAAPAAPAAPPPPPPPAMAKKSFIVFFDFDKSNITSQAQATINDAVAAAKAGNSARVTLTGHTDRSGSEQYNLALSLRRAEAVKAAMIKQGIPASAIVVIGKGESQPLVPTADGVREPQNRRVEIVI